MLTATATRHGAPVTEEAGAEIRIAAVRAGADAAQAHDAPTARATTTAHLPGPFAASSICIHRLVAPADATDRTERHGAPPGAHQGHQARAPALLA